MARVLGTEAAAELLGVEVVTVREWLRRGEIPGRRVGKLWRIPEEALMDWLRGPGPREREQHSLTEEQRAAAAAAAYGKYAGVLSGSDAFNRRKQEEIDREDRSWRGARE